MLQVILLLAIICIIHKVTCVHEKLAIQITKFSNFEFLINECSKHTNPATNHTISFYSIPMINDLTQKQMVIIFFI